MKKRLFITMLLALLAAAATGPGTRPALASPVSDPTENFHQVMPNDFDPGHTFLVANGWIDGIGCPTKATIGNSNATGTGIGSFSTYMDSACPTGDPKDKKNEGLLFVKTGPENNFASAEADLKKVKGISPLFELGYDLRKTDPTTGQGSHCGAGAPRFDVITTDGVDHFIGCNSPPATVTNNSATSTIDGVSAPEFGWVRLRWNPAAAIPTILPTDVVQQIAIVMDDGQDASGGPDHFGVAILDNIDVNGTLVGHGPDED